MQTLDHYLIDWHLSREDFRAKYPHHFLVLELEEAALEKKALGFTTVEITGSRLRAQMDTLRALENAGQELLTSASNVLIFQVIKNASNAYQGMISIGRTRQSDICIPDSRISKLHAYFQKNPDTGELTISDAKSRNGTTVNGVAGEPHKPMPLKPGDTVSLGTFRMRFLDGEGLYDLLHRHILKR